jgi:hypothetical protein
MRILPIALALSAIQFISCAVWASEQPANIDDAQQAFVRAASSRALPQSEITGVLESVKALLQNTTAAVPMQERRWLAEQILRQAAEPTSINQGKHNTCSVSALEARLSTREPSVVASVIQQAALKGFIQTRDGRNVALDANALRPDAEAAHNPPHYGERSYASQLFQLAAINSYWQNQKFDPRGNKYEKGQISYTQKSDDIQGKNDTGERMLIAYPSGVIETVMEDATLEPLCHPAFSLAQIKEINFYLTGREDGSFLIGSDKRLTQQGTKLAKSAKHLSEALISLKQARNLPAIVAIDGELVQSVRSLKSAATGQDGWHVINIVDIDESTGLVDVDNWWGERSDKIGKAAIPVAQVFSTPAAFRAPNLEP